MSNKPQPVYEVEMRGDGVFVLREVNESTMRTILLMLVGFDNNSLGGTVSDVEFAAARAAWLQEEGEHELTAHEHDVLTASLLAAAEARADAEARRNSTGDKP
jgi:hypothetical protein